MSSEKHTARVEHEFPPVFDENSRVLILGTIPSPKSRERGFYYMHPQNRFWRMLSEVLGEEPPADIPGRREMCLRRGVALWDVLAECSIDGASDSSIKNAVPKKAQALYERFFPDSMKAVCLPSTSPANRTISEAEMLEKYRQISDYLP